MARPTHYDGNIMMARTQLSLDPELLKRAKAKAADQGVSLAAYLRRLVEADLGAPPAKGDISAIFDLGDSGGSDITHHKHEYIGDAFWAEYLRKMGRT